VHDPFRLDGIVALVTGAGSGIGRVTALILAAAGADVAVAEHPDYLSAAEETAKATSAYGRRAMAVPLDVTRVADIEPTLARVERELGPIGVLVNNAGINRHAWALEITEADWDAVVDTNLKGCFFCAQAVARRMVERGGGAIVNVASQYGLVGYHRRAHYCASKGGLVNLTRALAVEWADRGVRVNAVAPTFVRTPLLEKEFADPTRLNDALTRVPMGRFAAPEDVAYAILYLASPAARMVTGHVLVVDGGYTAA
jgi:2-deoxy-D-gluconate 3-dehydrogenase